MQNFKNILVSIEKPCCEPGVVGEPEAKMSRVTPWTSYTSTACYSHQLDLLITLHGGTSHSGHPCSEWLVGGVMYKRYP
jgi:hypothetical protein